MQLDTGLANTPPQPRPLGTYRVPDKIGPGVSIAVQEDRQNTKQFAVDDERIYWISTAWHPDTTSRVRSCRKVDCPSTGVTYDEGDDIATGDPQHDALVVGGGRVAWTVSTGNDRFVSTVAILVCPSSGCAGAPTVVASNVAVTSLAIDETHVYWSSTLDTAVLRRSLTGSGTIEAIALNEISATQLRVGENHVYWISSPSAFGANASVKRVLKQGGAPVEVMVKEQNQGSWLALDSSFFYWANSYLLGTISRCPLSGCADAPTLIIGDQNHPGPLLTDGKSIFWTAVVDVPYPKSELGAVVQCPIDGCASQVDTFAVQTFPEGGPLMAVDQSDVYWLGQGSVPSEGGLSSQSTIYRHSK